MVYLVTRSKEFLIPLLALAAEVKCDSQIDSNTHRNSPWCLITEMQKCPSHDLPRPTVSRQKCQVLWHRDPWWLHSPSCLQVSWQETEALPIGERMDSEARSTFSCPSTHSSPLTRPVTVITKTWRSVLLFHLSSVPLPVTNKWKRRNAQLKDLACCN